MGLPRFSLLAAIASVLLTSSSRAGDNVVAVPPAVHAATRALHAEGSSTNALWLDQAFSPNLVVSEWTTITLVALDASPSTDIALGWFTFEERKDGKLRVRRARLLEVGLRGTDSGARVAGAAITLCDDLGRALLFGPGERLGFFLEPARSPARGGTLDPWVGRTTPIDPAKFSGFGPRTFTTLDALNPESQAHGPAHARHAGMAWMPSFVGFADDQAFLLVGFEDSPRSPELAGDFDDVVFAIVPGTIGALAGTLAPQLSRGDEDRDGVDGAFDAFPRDRERAFTRSFPPSGCATLALEDAYPDIGDLDYNDALIRASWVFVSDAQGRVKDVLATLHLVGSNPRMEHRFGLRLPPLPADVQGGIWVERFWGTPEQQVLQTRAIEEALSRYDGGLPAPFPSTRAMSPSGQSDAGEPACARVRLSFDVALDPAWLEPMPLEPYFVVKRDGIEIDVHLPGSRAFAARDPSLPRESGSQSFLSSRGHPYVLFVPQAWRAPAEGMAVWGAYPDFRSWLGSGGERSNDWYTRPGPGDWRLLPQAPAPSIQRPWSLQALAR